MVVLAGDNTDNEGVRDGLFQAFEQFKTRRPSFKKRYVITPGNAAWLESLGVDTSTDEFLITRPMDVKPTGGTDP